MFPFLNLHFFQLPMYGVSIVTGILLAGLLGGFLCKKDNKDIYNLILISALVLGFGFVFAKILYILVSYPIKDFFKVVYRILFESRSEFASGFVFYGGLIGGAIGYFAGIKIAKCKFSDFVNIYAVLIPLVHGFGRIGCFCAGCCYGIPYDGFLSVHYTHPLSSVPTGIGIFPVQLVEAVLLILLSLLLLVLFLKNKKSLLGVYLCVYAVIRFALEYLRFDAERGHVGFLSVSQFISVIMIIIGITILLYNRVKSSNMSEQKINC